MNFVPAKVAADGGSLDLDGGGRRPCPPRWSTRRAGR